MKKTLVAIAVLSCGALAGAQEQGAVVRMLETTKAANGVPTQVEFRTATVESRITKGAPYAAEAITESTQVLPDGNRISRKSTVRVFRDSEGRTRREQIGQDGEVQTISISDPVSESTYVLDPKSKTAYRNGVIMAAGRGRGGVATASVPPGSGGFVTATRSPDGNVSVEAKDASGASAGGGSVKAGSTESTAAAGSRGGGGGRGGASAASGGGRGGAAGTLMYPPLATAPLPSGNVNREDLGQQVVEGVNATGSRSTTVIPAGQIGNDQPINIVSEQWFSPDLQVLVMTKHSDPRTGDITYRLANVNLAEQARSLFEVPADYTFKDSVIRRQTP